MGTASIYYSWSTHIPAFCQSVTRLTRVIHGLEQCSGKVSLDYTPAARRASSSFWFHPKSVELENRLHVEFGKPLRLHVQKDKLSVKKVLDGFIDHYVRERDPVYG